MASHCEGLRELSLNDPSGTLESLIAMHDGIVRTLKLAGATRGQVSLEFPSAAHQFQHITGCRRSEALYYLNHVPNNDIRSAVIVWHSQVLKDFLAKYQLPDQQQQQLPPGYKEHELKEQAETMRAKAKKAAAAAETFEMPDMAKNYLRTNFCSICKVERDVAITYMEATDFNIVAAVEEYIARHILHPAQTSDPDSGLAQHRVLLTRNSTAGSDQRCCRCHSTSSSLDGAYSDASWATASSRARAAAADLQAAAAAAGHPSFAEHASLTPSQTPLSSTPAPASPTLGQPSARSLVQPPSSSPVATNGLNGLNPGQAGPLGGGDFWGSRQITLNPNVAAAQYPAVGREAPPAVALYSGEQMMQSGGAGYPSIHGAPVTQQPQQQQQQQQRREDSFGLGDLRARFGALQH